MHVMPIYFLLSIGVARVKHLRDAVSQLAVAGAAVDREYVLARLKENVERAMQHQPGSRPQGQGAGERLLNLWPPVGLGTETVQKSFQLREGTKIVLGAEAYNLFNHPNFAVPSNTQSPLTLGGNGDAVFKDPMGNFATNVGRNICHRWYRASDSTDRTLHVLSTFDLAKLEGDRMVYHADVSAGHSPAPGEADGVAHSGGLTWGPHSNLPPRKSPDYAAA